MKKPWLERYHTHWQWYRELFSVGIFRYFVLWFSVVPVVVHALGSMPAVVPAKVGTAIIIFKPELPFNWVALWVASVCYTLALFVFVVRCPDFVKKHPTFLKYKEFGHSPRWIVWLAYDVSKEGNVAWSKLKNRLHEKGYAIRLPAGAPAAEKVVVEPRTTSFQFEDEGIRYRFEMPVVDPHGAIKALETDVVEREVFWEVFGAQSGSRKWSRGSILFLLAAALVLFLVVLGQHVWAAVPYVLEELLSLVIAIKLYVSVHWMPAA